MGGPMIKTYGHLLTLSTYADRLKYLQLNQSVGYETFGSSRYLNQDFYHSREWQLFRNRVITRDFGCDLGLPGFEICGPIYVHHINPLSKSDIINNSDLLFELDNAICVSFDTHQLIHYGFKSIDKNSLIERMPGDTRLW